MEDVLQQTYERLVEHAVNLMNANKASEGPSVSSTLSCIGFNDGTALSATVLSDADNTTMPLVMVLSVVRACADTEKCAKTKRTLQQIDDMLTRAIKAKVGADETTTNLH